MKPRIHLPVLSSLLILFFAYPVKAQFVITGQVRTRTELRQGQGTLPEQGAVPAFFTSQRTRLNVSYTTHRLKLFTAIQDARVWGQDMSTTNRITTQENNGLMLHEAWAEISLLDTNVHIDNLSLKLGRQELVYNDQRLLGNLDWLQQARRHDAAVLKFNHKSWAAHIGAAFNQNKEQKANTVYNGDPAAYPAGTNGIGTMYKAMQFIHINKKWNWGNTSLLGIKDDFNRYTMNGTGTAKIFERGVWSRITTGYHIEATAFKKLNINNSVYYQTGKDRNGKKLDAYMLSLYTTYAVSEKFSTGPGYDLTSGNNGLQTSSTNHAFDPLYGTPHKFWGYMDYFYVADGFGNGGLQDIYLRSRYKVTKNITAGLDVHEFYSANKIADNTTTEEDALNPRLGTELDALLSCNLTNYINIEGGYSVMFGTNTLDRIKLPAANKKNIGHWAYVMINIRPAFYNSAAQK